MAVDMTFILLLVVMSFQNPFTAGEENGGEDVKRLLLNDQNVVDQLNRNIQSLTQLVNTMKQEMDTQKAEITAQKAEITALNTMKQEMDAQKAEITALKASNAGSTYIRWGRTSCSAPNTKLVYTGYAAGQNYNQYSNRFGGAANMLCLSNHPEFSNLTGTGSYLWGTEFEENMIKSDAANEDVPCAVCKSTNTHVSIMIPGRRSCDNGWKREYNGVLASDHYSHSASSFICVDRNPEYLPAGQRNDDGRLLYFTTIKCGSLSCPPYKDDGKAVNCVVCSQ